MSGALFGVFEVEFDFGGGEASCGADADAGVRVVSGPASVEGAAVELLVDGGEGGGVDGFVEVCVAGGEVVAYVFGEVVEVVGVVGGEVFEAEGGVCVKAGVRVSQWSCSRPGGGCGGGRGRFRRLIGRSR